MSEKVYPSATLTASGTVGSNNAVYYGYTVTTVTATGVINIRRGSVSGQIIDVIPIATAVGTTKHLSNGLAIGGDMNGIFVEFNGGATGGVVIHYE